MGSSSARGEIPTPENFIDRKNCFSHVCSTRNLQHQNLTMKTLWVFLTSRMVEMGNKMVLVLHTDQVSLHSHTYTFTYSIYYIVMYCLANIMMRILNDIIIIFLAVDHDIRYGILQLQILTMQ